ncbi:MAG: hypothetical protein CVU62_11435 [Deltaproteobacteria bacterium HGW-Deltaproteobacteria-2]|jgi:rRNA maturation protein Nop10|nr:MAG: hypothetical protein CVU62_11435 [Deltaproteobacteria bacterium HGW-Deltaproteobacteria-2]
MHIECPHCNVEFNSEDIAYTLKKGNFKCPVCGGKIPDPSADPQKSTPISINKYIVPAVIFLVIAAALSMIYFLKPVNKESPVANKMAPVIIPPSPGPPPAQSLPTPVTSAPETAPPATQTSDKMQIIERIAAGFHKTHTYTLEGDFVCLDMAIDVWNQLRTNGIEAKIMGGNIKENVTTWNYRQLARESNHAWVVAKLSPAEKVAIETTAGTVIKPGMANSSAYFKGIEFDTPGEIKRFDSLRKKANEVCLHASELIKDWNENFAGKQRRPEEIIARQSQIEQRKQDCEYTLNNLEEFKSRAIFY